MSTWSGSRPQSRSSPAGPAAEASISPTSVSNGTPRSRPAVASGVFPPQQKSIFVALEHAHARRKCGGNLSDRGLFGNRHARASLPRSPRRPVPRARRCHRRSARAAPARRLCASANNAGRSRAGRAGALCLVRGTSRTRATRHAGVVGRFPGWAALPGRDQALAGIL